MTNRRMGACRDAFLRRAAALFSALSLLSWASLARAERSALPGATESHSAGGAETGTVTARRFDRLSDAPAYFFADLGLGYGLAVKAAPAPRELGGVSMNIAAGAGLPLGSAVAAGAGMFFNPLLTPEFGPGGIGGLFLVVYPIPHTGLNASVIGGWGGGGGGSGLNGRYGGTGPGFSTALAYDLLDRTGFHPTVGVRTSYMAFFRSPDFVDSFLSVTFGAGISFH